MTKRERRALNRALAAHGLRLCKTCEEPCAFSEFYTLRGYFKPNCIRCTRVIQRVRLATDKIHRANQIAAVARYRAKQRRERFDALLNLHRCPCCKQPMRVYEQPSPVPGRPSFELAECVNRDCALFMATLTRGEHAQLTPEQVAGYRRARERAQRRELGAAS